MEMRALGASGLRISAIGLGCNNFGQTIDAERSRAVVDAAIDAGITFFDTADVYGGTRSETILGEAIGTRRQSVVIATKGGLGMFKEAWKGGGSRRWLIQACEDSLRRLGTDYIDLYQLHTPDPLTPIEETLRALDDLVRAGKVRYIGCSNMRGWQIADADWTAKANGLNRFVSVQNGYNLLDRAAEAEVLPACGRFGLGFLPFFPLASGMLTGKYRRGMEPGRETRFATWAALGKPLLNDRTFDKVEALTGWAERNGRTLAELAFAWLLADPRIGSVIAGATRPEQVRANAAAGDAARLSVAERAEIDGLLHA